MSGADSTACKILPHPMAGGTATHLTSHNTRPSQQWQCMIQRVAIYTSYQRLTVLPLSQIGVLTTEFLYLSQYCVWKPMSKLIDHIKFAILAARLVMPLPKVVTGRTWRGMATGLLVPSWFISVSYCSVSCSKGTASQSTAANRDAYQIHTESDRQLQARAYNGVTL